MKLLLGLPIDLCVELGAALAPVPVHMYKRAVNLGHAIHAYRYTGTSSPEQKLPGPQPADSNFPELRRLTRRTRPPVASQ